MDKRLVCPCGLTCCDCLFHRDEIYKAARELKEILRTSQLDEFLNLIMKHRGWNGVADHFGQERSVIKRQFEPFERWPDFLHVLNGLIDLQCKTTCREAGGCSIGGITRECEALKCINENGFEGCWQCAESEDCERLSFLRGNYGETIDGNLRIIREKGIEAVESRGNEYYAWQRT